MAEPTLKVDEIEVGVRRGVEVAEDTALRPAVPDSVASPLRCLGLANGNGLTAVAADLGGGDAGGELVAD